MFDPVQLRSFLTVAQTLSFTQAGRRLGLRQSTVSQHIRKLEQAAGRRLFSRDTHGVELTEDGEAMLGFAGTILEANERAAGWFAGSRIQGRLRFGTSEDFVLTRLPEVLEAFRRDHPGVELELTVGLSGNLHERLAAGRLDLALAKRLRPDSGGELMWRDKLVWIGAERLRIDLDRPVPLIVYPPPGLTRARALEALEREGRSWRIACTSGSLSGLVAAARAGLGVMPHTEGMVPAGLVRVAPRAGLPDLGRVDFVLAHSGQPSSSPQRPGAAANALAAAILAAGDRLHRQRSS
ncbi:LysR family transcriptional regulator [Streptomyces sp. TP-A0874]|uniref:LysR family transcriptional regulator n=1 Tax=Streptomyces sp. TP-A0874 TaxID=549819 RepID=UPI000853E6AF|nr:LysR family transcriptional regulator [Streptomyces sp. TP-A0874]